MTTDCGVAWPAGCLGGLAAPQQALKRQRAKAKQASPGPQSSFLLYMDASLHIGASNHETWWSDQLHRGNKDSGLLCWRRLYCWAVLQPVEVRCAAKAQAHPQQRYCIPGTVAVDQADGLGGDAAVTTFAAAVGQPRW